MFSFIIQPHEVTVLQELTALTEEKSFKNPTDFNSRRTFLEKLVKRSKENDVILPCEFTQGPNKDQISQVYWGVLQTEGKNTLLIVSNHQHGVIVSESALKHRGKMKQQALTIKDVEMGDVGLYTNTFPGGIFEGQTNL